MAQEFETAFGRAALQEFVRGVIRDDAFVPGNVHRELLELPWADVFTTNYDRLLEIASRSLWKQRYDIVRTASDLPVSKRPRLVKLHGTLPDLENLVLTEDDYRTYPRRYAPFVATVQAALTENVLCLIGFSGDDPNFLAWAGWLRDEMRSAVPNTYLFTGTELKPFQRKLLEQRHIIPISLKRKRFATEFDYESAYLSLCKELALPPEDPRPPWDAGPRYAHAGIDPSIVKEPIFPRERNWIDMATVWKRNRERYQGWSVMYREGANRLWQYTEYWIREMKPALASEWTEPSALFVLHELVWRCSTALRPLNDVFVFEVLDPQMNRYATWLQQQQGRGEVAVSGGSTAITLTQTELAFAFQSLHLECLRHAREIGDDERFHHFAKLITSNSWGIAGASIASYVNYQRALHAIGRLQHDDARRLLESWSTDEDDPIWVARQAGLCLECGLITHGTHLLEATLERLRSVPVAPSLDIRSMSVEGIVLNLLWAARAAAKHASRPNESAHNDERGSCETPNPAQGYMLDRLSELGKYGCDPNDLYYWLQDVTSPEPRSTKGVQVREEFDIGSQRTTVSSGNEPQLESAYRAMRFIEDAGLPIEIPTGTTVTIAGRLFQSTVKTIAYFALNEAAGLFLRARDPRLAEEFLSRDRMAVLSAQQVESLHAASIKAVREALNHLDSSTYTHDPEIAFWEKQFRVAALVLGRVAVRLKDDKIRDIMTELIKLPHDARILNRRLCEDQLAEAIRKVGNCLTKASVEVILPLLIDTPVRGSSHLSSSRTHGTGWADPVDFVSQFSWKSRPPVVDGIQEKVASLLTAVGSAQGDERRNSCVRAAGLFHAGLLSEEQILAFQAAVFAESDGHVLPKDTGCLDALVLALPRLNGFDELAAFRAKFFDGPIEELSWQDLVRTRAVTNQRGRLESRDVRWSRRDLGKILARAEAWMTHVQTSSAKANTPTHPVANAFIHPNDRILWTQLDWLQTIEDVVLLNPRSSREIQAQAVALLECARHAGWCVTQAVAARVAVGLMTAREAVADIRATLGSRELTDKLQACRAMTRWHVLAQLRRVALPGEIQQILATLVETCRNEALPHVIDVASGVLATSDHRARMRFFSAIQHGLQALQSETEYAADSNASTLSMGIKLRTRVSCVQLAVKAAAAGIRESTVTQWLDAAAGDAFADVRRHR